jgi:hypothetical protein
MKTLVATLALISLTSGAALACTQDELTAKGQEFQTKLTTLAQKDPQKASKLGQEIAADAQKPENQPKSLDEACKWYDGLIAKVSE